MRKGVKGLLMLCVILITFSIFCLDAKAEGRPQIVITKLGKTSVEFNCSEWINKELLDAGLVMENLLTKASIEVYEYNDYKKGESVYSNTVLLTSLQVMDFAANGLKSGNKYNICINYTITEGNSRKIERSFYTMGSGKTFGIKQAGSTDTSITIDMRDSYDEFFKALKDNGVDRYASGVYPYLGIVKKTDSNAKAKAWDKAVNESISMGENAYYTIKGLEPSTHYSICVMVIYYPKGKSKNQVVDFFTLDDAYTQPKGNYSDLTFKPKYNSNNGKKDTYSVKYCENRIDSTDNISYDSTENSITLDWSKRTGKQALTNVKVGFSECGSLDLDKDKQKYGSVDNRGPYLREAGLMCDGGKLSVANNSKSYTFKNLKPAQKYAIVIKGTNSSGKPAYFYREIITKGNYLDADKYIKAAEEKSSYQMPYMYDVKCYKEGNSTIVDWTEAMNSFLSQSFWKNLNAKPNEYIFAALDYRETKESSYDRTNSYISNLAYGWTCCASAEKCATKARLYGFDPAKNYYICIRAYVTFYYMGDSCIQPVFFYYDSTGTNYKKLKALGQDRESREYPAKLAAIEKKGVFDIDLSSGGFTIEGEPAEQLFETIREAGKSIPALDTKAYIPTDPWYDFDLNADKKADVRMYFENIYDKYDIKLKFTKADSSTVKTNNMSYIFTGKALDAVQRKAVNSYWTEYYTGVNFIFRKASQTDDKKEDSSKKDEVNKKDDTSSSSSNEKSDDKSKKKSDSKPNNDKKDSNSDKSSNADSNVKDNKTITYKGYKYEIISSSAVRLVAPTKKSIKTVNVPAKIKYSKKTYKVTEIGDSAFKNCKKLKKVTISANVKVIGKKAFYGCKKLKSVEIKSKNLKKVGKKAFDKTSKELKISVPKQKYKKYKGVLKKAGLKAGKIKQSKK